MNYYPFHIGDYVSATRHLSWVEDAAYRRLLDTYYVTEKPLPDDLRQVCRLVLATTEDQREAVKIILSEFFELTAEGWINSRADAEINAMREKQQKQRDKANKRWHKQQEEHGIASALPQHQESYAAASNNDANAMPPTPTPTPTPSKPKEERAPRFDAQAHLVSLGVDKQIASDWIQLRRAKKAPPSMVAIDGIASEAAKARIALSDALAICCRKGWTGFDSTWNWGQQQDNPRNGKTQHQLNQEATTRAIFGNPSEFAFTEKLISGEVIS